MSMWGGSWSTPRRVLNFTHAPYSQTSLRPAKILSTGEVEPIKNHPQPRSSDPWDRKTNERRPNFFLCDSRSRIWSVGNSRTKPPGSLLLLRQETSLAGLRPMEGIPSNLDGRRRDANQAVLPLTWGPRNYRPSEGEPCAPYAFMTIIFAWRRLVFT